MPDATTLTTPGSTALAASPIRVDAAPPADPARVQAVADGLRGEFTALLRELPGGIRNVSELSRHLQLPRPVCQRLVAAIRRASGPDELLLALPGVRGLEQVVAAARARRADAAAVARADRAVGWYADLVDAHGGSQAKLNLAIRAADHARRHPPEDRRERAAPPPAVASRAGPLADETASEGEHRRRLFEAGRALSDRWCEYKFNIALLAPGRTDAFTLDHVGAYGYVGLRRGPRGVPLCVTRRLVPGRTDAPDQDLVSIRDLDANAPMHGRTPQAILPAFSSQPAPSVVSHTSGMNIEQFIEFEQSDRGVDVVLADRSSGGRHPREDDPPLVNLSLLADAPPRALSITIFLHRTLARDCVASAGCFVPGLRGTVSTRQRPDGSAECVRPTERWFDRLAHRPPVEYLGAGLECAPTPSYLRMRELCEALFAAGAPGGWDPADFVGFRVSVEHPVWNAEYLLSLDFTPPDEI